MVNNFIPKVEEIREIKHEIPSYEEFMKTYNADEAVVSSYEIEYQNKVLNYPQYGPGNEQSKTLTKVGVGVGLTVLTVICPPAGAIVATGVATEGALITAVGLHEGDEQLTNFGVELIGTGVTGAIGGAAGSSAHASKICRLGAACPK